MTALNHVLLINAKFPQVFPALEVSQQSGIPVVNMSLNNTYSQRNCVNANCRLPGTDHGSSTYPSIMGTSNCAAQADPRTSEMQDNSLLENQ